ncbi:MAG: hypothetical protein ACLQPD_31105 [Desulfomonilaceae bacterium]
MAPNLWLLKVINSFSLSYGHALVPKDFALKKTEAGAFGGHGSCRRYRQESTRPMNLILELQTCTGRGIKFRPEPISQGCGYSNVKPSLAFTA